MKKLLMAVALLLPAPALAEPLAYPGTAWVNVSGPHYDIDGDKGNWITSAKVQQGVDWAELEGWRLQTFVSVEANMDTNGYDWNNSVAPAVGASVRKTGAKSVFEVGVQYTSETNFGKLYKSPDRTSQTFQVFANYWVEWGR